MTGDVTINGVDAYARYGVNLEDGALSTLMTPAPMKEFIDGKSRLRHGKSVVVKNARYDSREMTLPFHLIAGSRDEFFAKYALFCSEVLSKGKFELRTKYQSGVVYRLVYLSCTQFRQFMQEMAVFSLKVEEPNPADRAEEE